MDDLIRIVIAIFLPPLGVFLQVGIDFLPVFQGESFMNYKAITLAAILGISTPAIIDVAMPQPALAQKFN